MDKAMAWSAVGFAFGTVIGCLSMMPLPLEWDNFIQVGLSLSATFLVGILVGWHLKVQTTIVLIKKQLEHE